MFAFAVGFLGFCLTGLAHYSCSMLDPEQPPETTGFVITGLLVLAGIVLLGHYLTARVTLGPDAIEVKTLWTTKRMDFSRIRGWREYETTDSDGVKTRYIELESLDHHQPALKFQDIYNFDANFDGWLRSLPKLGR
ncbi:MAG: hypothetical protein JO300_01040 [Silvibacterium sp.]|nr:hypothetical protein [Silvibacterium sp.]MBV8437234.1 hypothetical protein [Silvibacterium sp.]